ncbi:tensin-1-like isoform X3 [Physella acuta]|uniref:tensin-1-like isoform X3 n=1 Tax=Physella acuta TaxID=109671 RepID=UPI0027DBA401|nr:tensin-1-like isoform X3 [Physella acuta]
MLKFVTTKPPRARSSSGSGTPDRDVTHRSSRETSPSASSLRAHQSPRFVRKHHSFSQPHHYPDPKGGVPAPYRQGSKTPFVTLTSGDAASRQRGDTSRLYQAPPEFRSQDNLYLQQRNATPSHQQQMRQHLQPSAFQNTKYSYKQATPSESSGQYATLYFPPTNSSFQSSKENKFPLELKGLYSVNKEKPHVSFAEQPQETPVPSQQLDSKYSGATTLTSTASSSQTSAQTKDLFAKKPSPSFPRRQTVNQSYTDATTSRSVGQPSSQSTAPVTPHWTLDTKDSREPAQTSSTRDQYPSSRELYVAFPKESFYSSSKEAHPAYTSEPYSTLTKEPHHLFYKEPYPSAPKEQYSTIRKEQYSTVTKEPFPASKEPHSTKEPYSTGKELYSTFTKEPYSTRSDPYSTIPKEPYPTIGKEPYTTLTREPYPTPSASLPQSPRLTHRALDTSSQPQLDPQSLSHTRLPEVNRMPEVKQVMTSCVPQAGHETSNEAVTKSQMSSVRSAGLSSTTQSSMSSTMRDMLNKSHDQCQIEGSLTLDLVYITERIISMTFPSEGHDTTYAFNLKEVVRMLKTKHQDNYLILNLSEKRQDLTKSNPQVKDFGWPDHLAPPLERLCSLCKAIDSWLNADLRNVVVLHCKGGRSRIASVIAAYMHYSNICASADQALDRFAMKRFYDDKLGGLPLPSQRRYVRYFSGLLSGAIKINSNPLYLHHILIHGVPNFDTKGGCRPFIKVYQGMQPIFTSGVYNVTDNMQKVCISISPGIPLRGDILIKCYHKKTRSGQREVMWQCQFHTCAISDNSVVFSKQELDDAVLDPRFPDNGKVEFVFGPSSDVLVSVSGFKSDVTVPVDDNEETLARSDSYENFHRVLESIDAVDFNENGISSSQVTKSQVSNQRGVDHNKAPDGSLYATVTKRGPQSPPAAAPSHHGPPHLINGSISSSLDSGYAGHNTSFNSHYTSSATTSNNINNNISSPEIISPPYQSSQTTLTRKPAQTLEERTQLDELLSDLLSDQTFVSPTQRSPKSFQSAVESQAPLSPSGGNVATSPTMSAAKTVTTTTRTFTSYSSTDAHRNPDRVLIQRAEVSYKVPGQGEVKDHYTIAADPTQMLDTSPTRPPPPSQYHPKGVPTNAFSYTSGISQQSSSQRAEVIEHDVFRSPVMQGVQSTPSSNVSYRTEYEQKLDTSSPSYSYNSLDGDTNSWLAQQQQKLKNFKEGRDSSGRTEQEKKLVNELRFAQNKYYTRRTQSEEEERAIMDSYNRQALHNGPLSPERVTQTYAPQRSASTSAVDAPWPQDQHYNTSYSTSSYMESRSYGDKRSNKPPPSPTMQRSVQPAPAPAPVPARTSSKEYMRTRSNSSSSNWQQQTVNQQQQKPLQRQQSDTLYDRNREVEHILPRSYGSNQSTPPHSPRAISPVGPISTTTYTTYRTIDRQREERQRERQEEMNRAMRVQQQQAPPPQQPPPQQPPTQINHHYITEVFVHRTDLNKDKTDSSTRLDELEKNLEAASQSIKASKSSQQYATLPRQPQVIEETVQHHSQQFHTYQESQKPEPPRVKEIEEDRIMLRPIGPGMQTLEPESAHTGTLGRPTTPGFPTGPATPPFPVSPRTPYQNSAASPTSVFSSQPAQEFHFASGSTNSLHPPPRMGVRPPQIRGVDVAHLTINEGVVLTGGQIISPTGTLQAAPMHQHQSIQYQQYQQSQSYQTQSGQSGHLDGQGQNSLHIDTSPKMLISPSAGSPPSPGNFNTLRQQLSSAHSMSGSVISPGPHSMTGQSSPSVYFGLSRRGSLSSLADSDMVHTTPKFVKDTSKYWYKPNISREDAIQMLKDKQPGTFVIRDSNSFPGAFGLALKVATIPPNVQAKPSGDPLADLVRHFLIEPTPKGVRLRGCSNEPVFGSLAALVYQHSITPLALPCKLALPEADVIDGLMTPESPLSSTELNSAATLLAQGAACNVIYINSVDMESLTGPQAVAKAVKMTFDNVVSGRTTMVHFKVSSQGITLTDNNRKLFFRRHYPVSAVTYCGMDPQDRRWKRELDAPGSQGDARLFGFVARKQGSSNENSCHIFAELDPEQPASAIVNFVTKVMIGQSKVKS